MGECGYKMDASTLAIGDDVNAGPDPGTVSLCIQCGEVCIFTEAMALRKASMFDLIHWSAAELHRLRFAQELIRKRKVGRKRPLGAKA